MSSQNLVSAVLDPAVKADILKKLGEIKGQLGFLLSMQSDDIRSLVKAGNSFAPFVEKAHEAVSAHPSIMAGVFDLVEFKKDYALSKDLTTIVNMFKGLTESLSNTLIAVNSDAMEEALEVYAAVKQNKDKVPGLNVIATEMGDFFKRSSKKKAS